jgi:hypothetical protein
MDLEFLHCDEPSTMTSVTCHSPFTRPSTTNNHAIITSLRYCCARDAKGERESHITRAIVDGSSLQTDKQSGEASVCILYR